MFALPFHRSRRKCAILIVLGLAFAAAASLLVFPDRDPAAPAVQFYSLEGQRVAMSELRGKVVLVEFWATDCVTCVKEMPDVVRTYERYRGQGFETVAVAMRYDPPNYVVAYAKANRLPFTVALDPQGELARAFGNVNYTPTTFVIDKRGRIAARLVGQRDFGELHALIEAKLKESA